MAICDLKYFLEVLSAILALSAAVWWFAASWIARGFFLKTPIARFDRVQRLQARFNAIAAGCAGAAALMQIAVSAMPVCRAFS